MESDALNENVLVDERDDVLAALAPHDFDAFAELYRRHLDRIYRFVRSQVADSSTTEDLTAQIFFKALASAGSFRGEAAYHSWLYRIAHNVIATWGRQRARTPLVVASLPDTEDMTPSPATQAINGEQREMVRAKVAELPPAQREVVALRYLEDFSIEEVADVTDRSRGAVRILLHRARLRLRRSLEGKELHR